MTLRSINFAPLTVLFILSPVPPASAAQSITDSTTKIEILRAAFPGTRVATSAEKPLDWKPGAWPGHPLTDALAGESEYEVSGPPDKFEEAWATSTVSEDADVTVRRLRLRVYEVKATSASDKEYVALAHYQFSGIRMHPFCCEWFARLFVLTRQNGAWTVHQTNESLINRAKTIRSFRVLDLDGDGREEAIVEAENTATGYRRWIEMSIFAVSDGKLVQLSEVETLSTNDAVHTQYSKELNIEKTRRSRGRSFFFMTTEYGDKRTLREEVVNALPK